MIKSMTAYAVKEAEIGTMTVSCELRSVNHRYLDIIVKLPERLRFIEAPVRTVITETINRGKIECSLVCKQAKYQVGLCINHETVNALLAATQEIERLMPAPLSFSALEILAFPGVQQEAALDHDALYDDVIPLLRQALADFVSVREREGAQLKQLIEDRCQKIQAHSRAAALRMPQVLAAIRSKLKDRMVELVAQPDFDRLEQELVFLAQKLDVAEELDRLDTHVTEVLRVLAQPEPAGRRLDFLMQELNREANTLGSKSADKEMTQIAIELKVLIEQMREQVQNIE